MKKNRTYFILELLESCPYGADVFDAEYYSIVKDLEGLGLAECSTPMQKYEVLKAHCYFCSTILGDKVVKSMKRHKNKLQKRRIYGSR